MPSSTEGRSLPNADEIKRSEVERRASIRQAAPVDHPLLVELTTAADQFLVKRDGAGSVIAGCPLVRRLGAGHNDCAAGPDSRDWPALTSREISSPSTLNTSIKACYRTGFRTAARHQSTTRWMRHFGTSKLPGLPAIFRRFQLCKWNALPGTREYHRVVCTWDAFWNCNRPRWTGQLR